MNSVLGPVWESTPWLRYEKVSVDGGQTFEYMTDEVIFGTYFFLADDKFMHELKRFSILDLLSHFGGLLSSSMGLIGGFLAALGYHKKEMASKII